jgi:uncharacterized protein (TIGR02646 family)
MRRIVKGPEPEILRKWKKDNAEVPKNLRYSALHGTETRAIRQQMLIEQGYLCAYTMRRIRTADNCHIEHIVPQTQAPGKDLDYTNMLACFPGRFPGNKRPAEWKNPKCPYGAMQKDGTHIDETNFVSPLREDVESRFQYCGEDGSVRSDANDAPASNSIKILQLNHGELIDLRKAAIDERVLDASLSAEEADELAVAISSPGSNGMLSEFCTAIAQVSVWYANAMRSRNKLDALFE